MNEVVTNDKNRTNCCTTPPDFCVIVTNANWTDVLVPQITITIQKIQDSINTVLIFVNHTNNFPQIPFKTFDSHTVCYAAKSKYQKVTTWRRTSTPNKF